MTKATRNGLRMLDSGRAGLRAVDYLRVSTEQQVKGYGISYSGKRTAAFITRKGWLHVGTYADEGYSGSLPAAERPDLRRLMEAARLAPRPFDVVVVPEERVIGRAGEAFWPWVWELRHLGVFVAIVRGNYDNTTDDGESRMRKAADRAEDERILIRDRTQGGIQEKGEEGGHTGGKPPYGYRIQDQGKRGESHLVLDEDEAEVLRLGAKLFLEKRSWALAAVELNSRGLLTRSGRPWTADNLSGRVMSPIRMAGVRIFRGSQAIAKHDGTPLYGPTVEIELDRVFSPELAHELKRAHESKYRPRSASRREYVWTGRLNSLCGGHYIGASDYTMNPVYRCSRRPGCKCKPLDAQALESGAWARLCEVLSDGKALIGLAERRFADRARGAEGAQRRVEELERQLEEQEGVIAVATAASARQALARGLVGQAAEEATTRATAPLVRELASLEKLLTEARSWAREAANAGDQMQQLRELAAMARERLAGLEPGEQGKLLSHLGARGKVLAPPRPTKIGPPCSLLAWFTEQGLETVPTLTDEGWERVQRISRAFRIRDARMAMESILEKAVTGQPWTDFPGGASLQQRFRGWRLSGLWGQAVDALSDTPQRPLFTRAAVPDLELTIRPFGATLLKTGGEESSSWGQSRDTALELTLTLTA